MFVFFYTAICCSKILENSVTCGNWMGDNESFHLDSSTIEPTTEYAKGFNETDRIDLTNDGLDFAILDFGDTSRTAKALELQNLYLENAELKQMSIILREICPEWRPCLTFPEIRMSYDIIWGGCCLSCSCEDNCAYTGSCCPGFKPNITMKLVEQLPTVCKLSVLFTNNPRLIASRPSFRMVSSCPIFSPEFLQQKCAALSRNESRLHRFDDIVPVTDLSTFSNRYCASCHGISEENVVFWRAKASCGEAMQVDRDSIEKIVQEENDCWLNILPPTSEIGNNSLCFLDMVTTCNATGLWGKENSTIKELCNTTDWVFQVPGKINRFHKNIFCTICNGENYTDSVDQCPADIPRSNIVSFSVIFAFTQTIEDAVSANNVAEYCPLGWMVDPLLASCKEIFCWFPRVYSPTKKTCIDVYYEVNFGTIEQEFEIVSSNPITLHEANLLLDEISVDFDRFVRIFGCNVYRIYFKIGLNFSELVDDIFLENRRLTKMTLRVGLDTKYSHKHTIAEINDIVTAKKISVLDTDVTFENSSVDHFFLPTKYDLISKKEAERYIYATSTTNGSGVLLAVYRDPYDMSAIFGLEKSIKENCPKHEMLYDRSFISCPLLTYSKVTAGFMRVPEGLFLRNRNVTIQFGSFRSFNLTHVAICVDTIVNQIPYTPLTSGHMSCCLLYFCLSNVEVGYWIALNYAYTSA